MKKCISVPISWLRLEQRALGELTPDARRETEEHLRSCEACREAAAEIAKPNAHTVGMRAPRRVLSAWRQIGIAASVLAAAAGVLLYLSRAGTDVGDRSKGSGVAVRVVVEMRDDGSIPPAARTKLLVTCARQTEGPWDVAVIENGVVSYPLAAATSFACGNEMPYPAALVLTGDTTMDVCVLHGKMADRSTVLSAEQVRLSGACTSVTPNQRTP